MLNPALIPSLVSMVETAGENMDPETARQAYLVVDMEDEVTHVFPFGSAWDRFVVAVS